MAASSPVCCFSFRYSNSLCRQCSWPTETRRRVSIQFGLKITDLIVIISACPLKNKMASFTAAVKLYVSEMQPVLIHFASFEVSAICRAVSVSHHEICSKDTRVVVGFVFSETSVAYPTPYLMGIKIPSTAIRRPERESNHLARSSAEVRNEWSCTYASPRALLVCAVTTIPLSLVCQWAESYISVGSETLGTATVGSLA